MNTVSNQTKNVNVNLSLIDKDIANLEAEIIQKQKLLAGKKAFREGITSLEEKGLDVIIRSVYNGIINTNPIVEQTPRHVKGVGDFILQFLSQKPKAQTKEIMQEYAVHIGSTVEDVRNNVQNTLSRLKSSQKIKNKENKGGRRFGSKWWLTPAQSN